MSNDARADPAVNGENEAKIINDYMDLKSQGGDNYDYHEMANAIRFLSLDSVMENGSGSIDLSMGMADVCTVLFKDFLKFNPKDAEWADRDRFVLSGGDGSSLLHSLLYLSGYPDMQYDVTVQKDRCGNGCDFTKQRIKKLGELDAKATSFGTQPELKLMPGNLKYPPKEPWTLEDDHMKGVEIALGSLSQGSISAVGMALTEKILNKEYGDELVDHYTYAVVSDECLNEGASLEAITFAAEQKLNKLIYLWDYNADSNQYQVEKFEAAGWHVQEIDAHDVS